MAKKKESATAEARKAKESPKVSHLTWFHEIFEKSHHSSYSYEFFKTCILILVAVPVFLTGFFYSREEARPGSFIVDVFFFTLRPENDTTGGKWKWQSVKLTGSRPSPRTGLSVAVNASATRAFFFGGVYDDEEDDETLLGSFFDDLYCLDLERFNFHKGGVS